MSSLKSTPLRNSHLSRRHHFATPYKRPSASRSPLANASTPHAEQELDIASYDPPRPRLRELKEDWEIGIIVGVLKTFDVLTGRIIDWDRHVFKFLTDFQI